MIYNYTDTLLDKWVDWCDGFLSHPLENNLNDVNAILNTTGADNPTRANEFNNMGLLKYPLTRSNIAFDELRNSRSVISDLGYISYHINKAQLIANENFKLKRAFSALNALFLLQQYEDFNDRKYSLNFIIQSLLTFYPIPDGYDAQQYLRYLSAAMFCELKSDKESLLDDIVNGIAPKLRIIDLKTNQSRIEINSSADVIRAIDLRISLSDIILQKSCLFLIGTPRDTVIRGLFYSAYHNFKKFLDDAYLIEKESEDTNIFDSIFLKKHNTNVLLAIKNIFTQYNRTESLFNIMKTLKEGSIEASKILEWSEELVPFSDEGKNIIYYGAPGTGKSYTVDLIIQGLPKSQYERVTFHPEFDNAAFIGSYKPIEITEEPKKGEITYGFVPQAFTKIYINAWLDTDNKPYYLIIEEINRGNCAEIFGEIFQLLDRNSKYDVTPSEELSRYLVKTFGSANHPGIKNGLMLPPNLNILATMNTSDQSLYPMDSAFKRRWEWEYIPICYKDIDELGNSNPSFSYVIDIEDGHKYSWLDFIGKINQEHILTEPALGMDKCIGNYFIKPDEGNIIKLKPFINKVIFYLWNDVFKDENNEIFLKGETYESYFPIYDSGKQKIKDLFTRLSLNPVASYEEREEEEELGNVAEDRPENRE